MSTSNRPTTGWPLGSSSSQAISTANAINFSTNNEADLPGINRTITLYHLTSYTFGM